MANPSAESTTHKNSGPSISIFGYLPAQAMFVRTGLHTLWVGRTIVVTARKCERGAQSTQNQEGPRPEACVRCCSPPIADKTRLLSGQLRTSHWLPSQLHRATGTGRKKPVAKCPVRSFKRLRSGALGHFERPRVL